MKKKKRKTYKNRILSILVAICMLGTMTTGSVPVAAETMPLAVHEVTIGDLVLTSETALSEGEDYTYQSYAPRGGQLTLSTEQPIIISLSNGTTQSHTYIEVSGNIHADITLDNVDILPQVNGRTAFGLANGATVSLTLCGANKLTGNGYSGLDVLTNTTLIITEKSNGSLTARGGFNGSFYCDPYPGIGVDSGGGTITINGGTVTAIGGGIDGNSGGAGIGGSDSRNGGTVTINGGTVTATGAYGAAGIGAGYGLMLEAGTLKINGGTVIATNGEQSIHGFADATKVATNDAGIALRPATITVGNGSSLVKDTAITGITTNEGHTYGCNGLTTDQNGQLQHIYLPKSTTGIKVTTGSGTQSVDYYGSVTTGADDTLAGTVTEMISPVASDFIFTAPSDANLTYTNTAKAAVVEAKEGKTTGAVTLKYYDASGTEVSPVNVGIYRVKIDVAEAGAYYAATDLTQDSWTFTIQKGDQAAPAAFQLQYIANGTTDYTVTIPEVTNGEYSFDGVNYSKVNRKTGVKAGEKVTGYIRYAQTANLNRSNATDASVTLPQFLVLASAVTLNKTSVSLKPGKTVALKTTIAPANATNKGVTYTSSNKSIATVSASGVVKGVKAGSCTITATAKDGSGKRDTLRVTVSNYTITYKLNKGTNSKSNPKSYTVSKGVTLKNPTRKGYIFKGWYTNSKFKSGTKITKIGKGTAKDYTIYAKWEKVSVAQAKAPKLSNPKSHQLKITYGKTSGVKGYEITYATNGKFTKGKKTTTLTRTSKTITKLKKGTTYYVRVRAYKTDSTGAKVYGKYSSVKKLKLKK